MRGWSRLLLACAVLAGCGGDAPGATASPTPAHSSSGTLTTSRFTVAVPTGWRDRTGDQAEASKFSANGTVLALFESPPPGQPQPNVNDVTANINIVLAAAPVSDDQLSFYLSSVSAGGATNVSQPEPFMVDGHAGLYITYERDVSGTPGKSQDMVVNYKGESYDIFLNTSKYAFAQQLGALKLILQTWRWKG